MTKKLRGVRCNARWAPDGTIRRCTLPAGHGPEHTADDAAWDDGTPFAIPHRKHGGKRAGSGRPGPRRTHVTIACSLDSVAADQIRALAKARAQSVGEYVRAALTHAVEHQLRGDL